MVQNALASRVRVPSISQAAGNALNIRAGQENIRGAQTRNALAEKQLGSYEEDRSAKSDQIHLQNQARAITTALQSPDPVQATNIFKSLGGDPNASFKFEGDQVEMDYGTHTIKGPREVVSKMMGVVGENGIVAKDPKMWEWFAKNGGSMEQKEVKPQKQTPAEILKDKKDLEKFKDGLKSKSDKSGGKPPTKQAALKRISDIQKAKATLEKTDMVTQLLAKENPELAAFIGQKMDPQQKADLMEAWDNELDNLEKFSGTTRRKEPITPTGGGATHTFIPGQGIVPIQ